MEQAPTFQEILNVSSEKELRSKGKLNEIRKIVNDGFGFRIPGHGRGWKGYYNRIVELQKLSTLFHHGPIHNHHGVNGEDIYFKSEASRYIYALTELDGQHRMKELEIDEEFYYDKEKAKTWRDHISKLLHPDVNPHPLAATAHAKLNDLYNSMTA